MEPVKETLVIDHRVNCLIWKQHKIQNYTNKRIGASRPGTHLKGPPAAGGSNETADSLGVDCELKILTVKDLGLSSFL
jgi:hypothetical protein